MRLASLTINKSTYNHHVIKKLQTDSSSKQVPLKMLNISKVIIIKACRIAKEKFAYYGKTLLAVLKPASYAFLGLYKK